MKTLYPVLKLFVVPATLLACSPSIGETMLLRRFALYQGEWWRLWTGHWVHFSNSHLLWNLLVILLTGMWLEKMRPGLLLVYTLLAPPVISLVLLLGAPGLQTFGGLSGLATGLTVLLAVTMIDHRSDEATWGWRLLLLVGLKLGLEASQPSALFSRFDPGVIQSVPLAHLAGAAIALTPHIAKLLANRGISIRRYLASSSRARASAP